MHGFVLTPSLNFLVFGTFSCAREMDDGSSGWLLPQIPDNPNGTHRAHMESWCDGVTVRRTGGEPSNPQLDPHASKWHLNHHVGYCAARAAAHSFADELWAGETKAILMMFTLLALAVVLLCSCCCVSCCCARSAKKRSLI